MEILEKCRVIDSYRFDKSVPRFGLSSSIFGDTRACGGERGFEGVFSSSLYLSSSDDPMTFQTFSSIHSSVRDKKSSDRRVL